MSFLQRRWPLGVLALLPLLVLGGALLRGEALGPFDQIQQMAPWNGKKPAMPWDVLPADGVLQFYPWRDLVLTSWGQGVLPAWNPYTLAGTPLLANSQSGALYPPHILLGVLHVPVALAMVLLAWFHLALAGIGTYAIVRRLGGSEAGAAVAGATFSLSPFMLSWSQLPSVITTVAWIPWVLTGIVASFWSREGESTNAGRIGLPVSVAMLLLAGHLQFAAYGLMAAILTAAILLVVPAPPGLLRSKRPIAAVFAWGFGLAVGAMLAAPHLLPVLQYGQFSHRRNTPTEEGYTAYLGSVLHPSDLVARLVNPFGQGDPTDFVADSSPISTFWPALSRQGANYAESALTIGPIAFLLIAMIALTRPSPKRLAPALALSLFSALIALGTPLNRLLYFFAPGWSASGSPGRVICLLVLGLVVTAGLAIPNNESSEETPLDAKRLGIVLFIGVAIMAVLAQLPLIDSAPTGMAADAWATITGATARNSFTFLLGAVISAGGAFAALRSKGQTATALWLGTVAVSTLALGSGRVVRSGDASFLKSTPLRVSADSRASFINSGWALTEAAPALYPPNTPTVARIHDLGGYDSLLHRDTQQLLAKVDGGDPAPPANGNMMFIKPTVNPEELKNAGVSEVFSRRELPQLGTPQSTEGALYRYHLEGPGRASTPAGPAKVESENLQTLTLSATGPGTLTLRDRNMEGWIAKVDGKHVPITGTLWREVALPAGTHQVQFSYIPPGFMPGLFAAGIGLLLLVGSTLVARRATLKVITVQGETTGLPTP